MKRVSAKYDLVLIGGGHAHALALRMMAMNPPANTRITLISPEPLAPYSGMLPGLIAGHFQVADTHIDLPQLCHWSGARFIQQTVAGIDTRLNRIALADGSSVDFDWLSVNVGGIPNITSTPGAEKFSIPVKPVSGFYPRWKSFLDALSTTKETPPTLVVVGGGAGGCELVLAMAHAAERRGLTVQFKLVTRTLLAEYGASAQRAMRQALSEYQIELIEGARVDDVTHTALTLSLDAASAPKKTATLLANHVFWCTGVSAPSWLSKSGLDCNDSGFIKIDATLRSISHTNIFATGDCALQEKTPAPRAGVYAVRQAAILAHNLVAAIEGSAPKTFKPQRHFLSLLSLGGKKAIAHRNGVSVNGEWMWRLKKRIDQRFIEKLNVLPPKPTMALENTEIERCAGCGAKVGDGALRSALVGLNPVAHENIIAGLAQREDASAVRWNANELLIQSHDYFPAFIDDPYLFGRIAALHSLSDVHARNATAHSALATVCVPIHHPRLQGRDISRLMHGAIEELNRADCALLGGHTIEGPQMAAGFTINAVGKEDVLLGKSGAQAGDKLLLTKPLGTGILLAGLMRPIAVGRYLDAMFEQMLISNRLAAKIFQQYGAKAVTDITGFGLLGHLLEMCDASRVSAILNTDAIPPLPGALSLIQRGVHSTLKAGNDAALARSEIPQRLLSHPMLTLMTDPQTSGGLIAAIPANQVSACINALRDQRQEVWEIGEVTSTGKFGVILR